MHGIDTGHALEHLAGQVRRAALARRAVGQLAGVGLQVLDEVGHVGGGHGRIGLQEHMHARHGSHGRQVLFGIEGQLAVDHRVDGDGPARAEQQRVAILGRAHGFADADVAARAGLVVHHHRLAQHLGHGGRDGARQHIGRAAGREVHDQAHGALGPFVAGLLRQCRDRGRRAQQGQQAQAAPAAEGVVLCMSYVSLGYEFLKTVRAPEAAAAQRRYGQSSRMPADSMTWPQRRLSLRQ